MSWKDSEYSPLYRPGQAFQEETHDRLPAVAVSFIAISALGMVLAATGSGLVGAVGTALFGLGAVVGGGSYTWIQIRAHHRRAASRSSEGDRPRDD